MQFETSGRPIIFLIIASLFLLVWLTWLGTAQVPVYAVADTAVLTSTTQATAQFTPDALPTVRPGQFALLYLDAFSEPVPATVAEVDQTLLNGRFSAQLRLRSNTGTDIPLQAGLNGRVEVEVERVTPFTLLLRTVR